MENSKWKENWVLEKCEEIEKLQQKHELLIYIQEWRNLKETQEWKKAPISSRKITQS